jgi:4-amino-4-deoxy-L-arabinose transferase-like glycosyltransferase
MKNATAIATEQAATLTRLLKPDAKLPQRLTLSLYFIVLATTFALITPIGYGFDEDHHLQYVSYVARTGCIPNQDIPEQSVRIEGHQPPLYYFLAAGWLRLIGTHDAVLGCHFLRLMSVLLASFNLALVFRVAAYFPLTGPWQLAPTLLVATLPQFAFVSGMVSNDSLANLLATAVICSLLAIHARPIQWTAYITLGCSLGLGIITKKTTFFLVPGAGVVFICWLWQNHEQRLLIALPGVVAIALCAVLSGWWFVRNHNLYGEWFGTEMEARSLNYAWSQQRNAPDTIFAPTLAYFTGTFNEAMFDDLQSVPAFLSEAFLTIPALMPFCVGMITVFIVGTLGVVYAWRVNRSLLKPTVTLVAVPGCICIVLGLYVLSSWYTSWYTFGDFWQLYLSAICHLGAYGIELPFGLYLAYGCMLLIALGGLVRYLRCHSLRDISIVVAIIFICISFAGVVYYNTMYNQAQGRLLFPALPLIAALTSLGLQTILSNRHKWLQVLTVGCIAGVVLASDALSVVMACLH